MGQTIYVPLKTPIAGPTGLVGREWSLFFRNFSGIVQALAGAGVVLTGTHAERLALDPTTQQPGTLWVESDRGSVAYIAGSKWSYAFGCMVGIYQQAPLDLGTQDENFQFYEQITLHICEWSGSGWRFAMGDSGNAYFQDFAVAPPVPGWHPCDGTLTSYLAFVGKGMTLQPFTPPDMVNNAVYLKSGSIYSSTIVATGGNLTSGSTNDPSHISVLRYFRR